MDEQPHNTHPPPKSNLEDELELLRRKNDELLSQITGLNRQLAMTGAVVSRSGRLAAAQYRLSEIVLAQRERRQNHLKLLLESSPTVVLMFDRAGHLDFCTEQFLRLADIPHFGMITGFSLHEIFKFPGGAELADIMARQMRKAGEEGKTSTIDVEAAFPAMPEPRRYTIQITPILDGAGVFDGAIIQYHDTTDLLQAEADDRTRLMLNVSPLACVFLDETGAVLDCNANAAALYGTASREEYMARFHELMPEVQPDGRDSRAVFREALRNTLREGAAEFEWFRLRTSGEMMPVATSMRRVRWRSGFRVVMYSRDLRRLHAHLEELRKTQEDLMSALDEAEKNVRGKSEFLARVSHEIRTPLNAVIGFTEMMLGWDGLAEEVSRHLGKIHDAAMMLLRLINDILDISKIESDNFALHPVRYDVPDLIDNLVALNVIRNPERPVAFALRVDEALPRALFGDELRVRQIFSNLLNNAFKYTREGRVEWSVSCERRGDEAWVVSDVTDTGIGIREKDRDRLFSAYSRLDPRENRAVGGIGLGLAITRKLLTMMGGSIAVTSAYGKGSTFTIRFPQRIENGAPIGREAAGRLQSFSYRAKAAEGSGRPERARIPHARVLVVDDVQSNLDVAKGLLKPYGMTVDCVGSGEEAVELVRRGKVGYDAIFMDHMMPGMDGIEAMRLIRDEIGTGYARTVPVIVLTANTVVGNEEMFLKHGFQDFLSKPIDLIRLDEVVKRWVGVREAERKTAQPGEAAGENPAAPESAKLSGRRAPAGFDPEKALALFGGDRDVYLECLRCYAVHTRPLLERIGPLAWEDLREYAVLAHGIKGSSYNVRIDSVGKRAEELEAAAKAGDAEFVERNTPLFVKYAEAFLDELSAWLENTAREGEKTRRDSPDAALLEKLRAACLACDMDGVDEAMEELERYVYTYRADLVAWLRRRVDGKDFREILVALSPD
jgi:PAS domain S-box-containing protein